MIATKKIWLTRDLRRVVEDGHPDAGFLIACAGGEIPGYLLESHYTAIQECLAGPKAEAKADAKAVAKPEATKAVHSKKTK